MARHVTFDSGSFTISSYLDKNFVLAVSTRMTLAVPAPFVNISTVVDLRDQVQNGSLWIARAGACHIELDIGFGESFEDEIKEALKHMCIQAFEDFPAWGALGLDVRREYNQFSEIRGSRLCYPYSIQHTQQNSGLIAPDQVPCAYLSTLSCTFTFGPKGTFQGIPAARQHPNDFTEHPTSPPVRSKVISLKVHPGDLRRILGVPEISSLPLLLQGRRLEHLTHTALHLIMGSRRRFPGIKFLKKNEFPTALEVAPAVWSARYFQDVVSRAQLTCFISSALADLVSTESPNFRHRTHDLGSDPAQEIHRRVLSLVLRSARVPKIQVHEQRTGYQAQNGLNPVVVDDKPHTQSISQRNIEEQEQQELLETRQDSQPHHGHFFYSDTSMYPLDVGSGMDHDEISTIDNDADVSEEPCLVHEQPFSYSRCSIGPYIPERLPDLREYDNSQRLTDQLHQDDLSYGPQSESNQETRDSLMIDAIDGDLIDDDMEETVLLTHHNFEDEIFFNDYDWHEPGIDMHAYSEDVDPRYGHDAQIGAGPESESELATRPRFLESEEAEGVGDEDNHFTHWQMQNILLGSDGFLVPRRNEHSQLDFDDYSIRNHSDLGSLDWARDQSFEESDKSHYCEDASIPRTDVFVDNNSGIMATQQEEFDEREDVGGDFQDNEEREFNGDVAEGEGVFALRGEDACGPSTLIYHHDYLSEDVVDDEDSQYEERSSHPYWTASSHRTGSASAYAYEHIQDALPMDCY